MKLSVLIPTWNEAENLAVLLPRVRQVVENLGVDHEVVVADNDSRDGTAEICRRAGVRCLAVGGRGYGRALTTGFAATSGEYLLTMDADLSHPAEAIRALWESRHGVDVVIASRYVTGGQADMAWTRLLLSRILNSLFRAILQVQVRDLSSGFRLYRRAVVSAIAPAANDFNILQEILIKAHALGYRVREIPFRYRRRGGGSSHARLVAFAWQYLKTLSSMWKLRNSVLSGDYDLRAFDSRIPLQRWWQRRRYRIILGWADGGEPALDVGCGSSRLLGGLAPGSLGIDPSIAKLRHARCHGRLLAVGALPRLPVASGAFRTLICSQVIEHIPRDEEIFEEFSRLLPSGGVLVVGTPDYGRVAWRLTEFFYRHLIPGGYADEHITHYTRNELRHLLRRHGFRLEEERHIGGGELIGRYRKD